MWLIVSVAFSVWIADVGETGADAGEEAEGTKFASPE